MTYRKAKIARGRAADNRRQKLIIRYSTEQLNSKLDSLVQNRWYAAADNYLEVLNGLLDGTYVHRVQKPK
jgi:hypothetical protein